MAATHIYSHISPRRTLFDRQGSDRGLQSTFKISCTVNIVESIRLPRSVRINSEHTPLPSFLPPLAPYLFVPAPSEGVFALPRIGILEASTLVVLFNCDSSMIWDVREGEGAAEG